MDENKLKSIIDAEISNSLGYLETETTEQRREALQAYLRQPYGWLQDAMHDVLRLWLGNPFELGHLHHDALTIAAEIFGAVGAISQLSETVGIKGTLCCWRTCKHPDTGVERVHDLLEDFPAVGLRVLIGVRLVDHDKVEATIDDLLLDDSQPVEVDDDELSPSVDDLLPLLGGAMRHAARQIS